MAIIRGSTMLKRYGQIEETFLQQDPILALKVSRLKKLGRKGTAVKDERRQD